MLPTCALSSDLGSEVWKRKSCQKQQLWISRSLRSTAEAQDSEMGKRTIFTINSAWSGDWMRAYESSLRYSKCFSFDLDRGYMNLYTCENAPNCSFKICALYSINEWNYVLWMTIYWSWYMLTRCWGVLFQLNESSSRKNIQSSKHIQSLSLGD